MAKIQKKKNRKANNIGLIICGCVMIVFFLISVFAVFAIMGKGKQHEMEWRKSEYEELLKNVDLESHKKHAPKKVWDDIKNHVSIAENAFEYAHWDEVISIYEAALSLLPKAEIIRKQNLAKFVADEVIEEVSEKFKEANNDKNSKDDRIAFIVSALELLNDTYNEHKTFLLPKESLRFHSLETQLVQYKI